MSIFPGFMVYEERGTAGDGFVSLHIYRYRGEWPFPDVTKIMVRSWNDEDMKREDPDNVLVEEVDGGDAIAIRQGIKLFDLERNRLQRWDKGRACNIDIVELTRLLDTLREQLVDDCVDVNALNGVAYDSIAEDLLNLAGGKVSHA